MKTKKPFQISLSDDSHSAQSEWTDLCVKNLFLKGRGEDEEDKPNRRYRFVASTKDMDADGDIVEQSWNLDRFKTNPVVLFAHNSRELPIGHAEDVGIVDGQLEATIVLASEKANPLAEQVNQSLREGTLRAVSVGFRPTDIRQEVRDEKNVFVLSNNELYEISVVPIPSNGNALSKMKELVAQVSPKGPVPYQDYPPVDEDSWDGAAAKKRIVAWATEGESVDFKKLEKGFAWFDSEKSDTLGAYKLPHHDVKDGELVTVREGVIAAGNAISGSRGGVSIPEGDMVRVRSHLARHYKQFDLTPPWESRDAKSTNGGKEGKMDFEKMLEQKAAELEKANAELVSEKSKSETLNQRCKDLEEERNVYKSKADELTKVIVEKQLDDLVGKKITPNERETLLKLAFVDGQLFEEHLKAVQGRADMPHLKEKIMGNDPSSPIVATSADGASGEGLERLIQQRAFGS